jgi:threonine/homoserine/homoserine lactone efflux protein
VGTTNLGLFLVASIALILAPGPDSLYVLARGLGQGRRAGIIAALGTCSGLLVHTTLAALGLAVLLQTSEVAYMVVRVGGALYLIYLGVRALLSRERLVIGGVTSQFSPRRMYLQGLLTNVLNPKVALFFIAFLPQFVDPHAPSFALSMLTLGLMFAALTVCYLALVGLLSGALGRAVLAATHRGPDSLDHGWRARGAGAATALPRAALNAHGWR